MKARYFHPEAPVPQTYTFYAIFNRHPRPAFALVPIVTLGLSDIFVHWIKEPYLAKVEFFLHRSNLEVPYSELKYASPG